MSRYDARLYLQRAGGNLMPYTQDDACVPLPPTTGTGPPRLPEEHFGPPPTFTHVPEGGRQPPQPSYGFRSTPMAMTSEHVLPKTRHVASMPMSMDTLPPSIPRPMPPLINGALPRAISAYPSASNYIKASTTFNPEVRAPSLPNLPTSQPMGRISGSAGTCPSNTPPVHINLLL